MALNLRQQKFCEHYAKNLNATKSAELAGYSKNSARQQGARLLSNASIKAEIARMVGKATAKAEISLDWILAELKCIVSSNMSDFCSWTKKNVELTPSAELTPELLAAVESVGETQDKSGRVLVKIRLHSKLQAAGLILKLYEISETEARLAQLEERLNEFQKSNRSA